MARENPEPVRRAVDRILGAETSVQRIWVDEEPRTGCPKGRATDLLVLIEWLPLRLTIRAPLSDRAVGHVESRGQLECQLGRRRGPCVEWLEGPQD